MKTNKLFKLLTLVFMLSVFFYSCTSTEDEPTPDNTANGDDSTDDSDNTVTITADEFTASIDENPTADAVIGTVAASSSDNSTLTYSLSNENIAGALAIDASTGELTVANTSVFDFERNTSITASYTASNGTEEETANITITVNDLDDSDFIFKWEVAANELIQINPTQISFGFDIDWGDGTIVTNVQGSQFHVYATAGEYTVTISGDGFHQLSAAAHHSKITSIEQWGNVKWKSMQAMFINNTNNIVFNNAGIPDLSELTDMRSMFFEAENFNQDMSQWDVSNVTDMGFMFKGAKSFNQDISGWDVSKVEDMHSMFEDADAFNQNIGNWKTNSVTNITRIFALNDIFNQDISDWDVSKVAGFSGIFDGAKAFNQNINDWDVSSGIGFARMFAFTDSFNQPLDKWDVSNSTNMLSMFGNAKAFNQPLSAWGTKTGKVTSMNSMFSGATNFDQDLSGWDVSGITNVSQGCFNFGKDSGMSASAFPAFTCTTQ